MTIFYAETLFNKKNHIFSGEHVNIQFIQSKYNLQPYTTIDLRTRHVILSSSVQLNFL